MVSFQDQRDSECMRKLSLCTLLYYSMCLAMFVCVCDLPSLFHHVARLGHPSELAPLSLLHI